MKNRYYALIMICLCLCACHSHKKTFISNGFFSEYAIINDLYGTETRVTISDKQRIMTTNSLPNHETGSFPNQGNPNSISEQERKYSFPLNPKYTGVSKRARQFGVAINGVKFEPGTAEVVKCESGESYRVEAFQNKIDLGLDFNNAHVQPTGAYHYHGSPTRVIKAMDNGEDLIHIGFAMDGFPIYYSKSNRYRPSYKLVENERQGSDCIYSNPHHKKDIDIQNSTPDGTYQSDWEYIKGLGDLDECNGIMIDDKYSYIITDDYPFIGRCLMGEFEESRRRGGPPPPLGGRRG